MSFDCSRRRVTRALSAVALAMVPIALIAAQTPPAQTPAPAPAAAPAAEAPKVPGLAGAIQGEPAHDPARAAVVLAEARKALGGEDKLKAVQGLEIKGKSARAAGNTNIGGDFEVLMELPDKFRRKEGLAMSSGDRGFTIDILQVMNGVLALQKIEASEGGQSVNFESGGSRGRGRGNFNVSGLLGLSTEGLDPRAREEAEHKAIAAEMARITAALLLSTSEPMVWIGTAQSPHGKADVLEFKTPDGVVTRLFIEDKKHLPLMLSWVGIPSQLGGNRGSPGNRGNPPNRGGSSGNRGGNTPQRPAPLQMYFSDYKAVNGVKLPHLIQSGSNDETNEEFVVKGYRVNPAFKADTFTVDK